jgi:hypothetical protein
VFELSLLVAVVPAAAASVVVVVPVKWLKYRA